MIMSNKNSTFLKENYIKEFLVYSFKGEESILILAT